MYAEEISMAATLIASLVGTGTTVLERRWIQTLLRESETNPEHRVQIDELGFFKRKLLKGFIKTGFLKKTSISGIYALNVEVLAISRKRKKIILGIIFSVALITVLVFLFLNSSVF